MVTFRKKKHRNLLAAGDTNSLGATGFSATLECGFVVEIIELNSVMITNVPGSQFAPTLRTM